MLYEPRSPDLYEPSPREYPQQFLDICQRWDLGELVAEPRHVTGGLLHRMLMLETTKGTFAAKFLEPEIMRRPGVLQNLLLSEEVARAMEHADIPAVPALMWVTLPPLSTMTLAPADWTLKAGTVWNSAS